jgi:NADH:ubiquinone oxidoreductase subunit F (NADH-binding)/(2Fe-2S) ferredoxin
LNYESLKNDSDKRWHELTNGNVPWIRVSDAMCCGSSLGSDEIVEILKNYSIENNLSINIDTVGCHGLCYAGTIIDVLLPSNPRVFWGYVTPDNVIKTVDSYINDNKIIKQNLLGSLGEKSIKGIPDFSDLPGVKYQNRIALKNSGNIAFNDIHQYIANDGFSGLNKALNSMSSGDVINEVKNSGLRGRGGAAFPTGVKWSFMANSKGKKYILCNCEEGDPGAFNDKGILESDPFTLIEGMIIAGYATNSTNGYVFIRHGHEGPIVRTEQAIKQAYDNGLLGENILGSGFSFDIEVSLTGDSYVAGEETALMESIEGKSSRPRSRPPFPAAYGVWGHPSTINNVKSLSYVAEIIRNGSEWFKSTGTESSSGTAIVCLSGDITNPGMYEVEMGLSIGDVIEKLGGGIPKGRKLKMLQTGGPLGGVLGSDSLKVKIDFDEMAKAGAILGSGGIIVVDDRTCAVDLTKSLVAFCQYESCGKCFPCRLGMTHLLEIVEKISRGEGKIEDLALMNKIGKNMQAGSLCGHGQLGYNPISSALKHFQKDFEQCMSGDCPTGSCQDRNIVFPVNTRPNAWQVKAGSK